MARIVHFSKTFKAIDQYCNQYNDGKPLKERISGTERQLVKEIAKIYTARLMKVRYVNETPVLPTLHTNNVQLSGRIHRTPRSIRNYMTKLITAGIVTDKIFHGSNSSYEISLLPGLLQTEHPAWFSTLSTDPPSVIRMYSSASSQNSKNLPHTESPLLRKEDKINIIIPRIPVEMESPSTQKPLFQSFIDEKSVKGNHSTVEVVDKLGENCAENKPFEQQSVENQSNTTVNNNENDCNLQGMTVKNSEIQNLTERLSTVEMTRKIMKEQFWEEALDKLYRMSFLTQDALKKGRKAIDIWYDTVPDDQLEAVHKNYLRRITHAMKYVQRDPEKRFIPIPATYFNTTFKNGFTGTREWDKLWRENKRNISMEVVYRKVINKYKRLSTARKIAPMEIYRQCEQQLGKLKNPVIMNQFWAEVLTINLQQSHS